MINIEKILILFCVVIATMECRYIPSTSNQLQSKTRARIPAISNLYSSMLHRLRLQNRRHPPSVLQNARVQRHYPVNQIRQPILRLDTLSGNGISKVSDRKDSKILPTYRKFNINLKLNDKDIGRFRSDVNAGYNKNTLEDRGLNTVGKKLTIDLRAKKIQNFRISHTGSDAGISIKRRGGNTRIKISRNPLSGSKTGNKGPIELGFQYEHNVQHKNLKKSMNTKQHYKFRTFNPSAWFFTTPKPLPHLSSSSSNVKHTKNELSTSPSTNSPTATQSPTDKRNSEIGLKVSRKEVHSQPTKTTVTNSNIASYTSQSLKTDTDLKTGGKANKTSILSTISPSAETPITATEDVDLPDLPDATEIPDIANFESAFSIFSD